MRTGEFASGGNEPHAAVMERRRDPGAPGWHGLRAFSGAQDDATLDAACALGFNAFLASTRQEPFLIDALDPAAIRADAARLRARHMHLLLDIDLHRVSAEYTFSHPEWFRRAALPQFPLDPRADPHPIEYLPRFDHAPIATAIASQIIERLANAVDAGATGFAVHWPQRIPATVMRTIIDGVRKDHAHARFLAWAPGCTRAERAALADSGFHASFCSLPWWDYRAPWFADELVDLRHNGSVLAPVDMPGGHDERASRAFARALACARTCADGWLLRGAELLRDAAFSTMLRDANNAFAGAAPRDVACVSAPWAVASAWCERFESGVRLTLINSDLDHHITLATKEIGRQSGLTLAEDSIALAPGEVREVTLASLQPVRMPPASDALGKALAAPRIAIENVEPAVDNGRFAAKRVLGDTVVVEADVFADGHPTLAVHLLWRTSDEPGWRRVRMRALGNDRWRGEFPARRLGCHLFAVEAGIDEFGSLRADIEKKIAAGQSVALEIEEARALIEAAARRAHAHARALLRALAQEIVDQPTRVLAPECAQLVAAATTPAFRTQAAKIYSVMVERRAAQFAAWYELFPRSQGAADKHGTFRDVIAQLPRIAAMGFDVLYLTPIHPIGDAHRKGRNNALRAQAGDPGSPYAIGAAAGGHDAVHPQLGTLEDFRALVAAARAHGMEIALDFAVQCSPDHPWIKQHPEWFAWRPDGSLRYAENPPKKYEDIVNVDFYAKDANAALWTALRDVVAFWMRQGVKTFRVDNPHTKPLPFWEWLIAQLRALDPEVVFLSEAFTRPKPMYRLAKLGFAQSYTYFTWRNSRAELESYLNELNAAPVREFFRPHFFVNTPDINPTFLQTSGRAGFLIRAALAATLSGLWGMYSGFELCESAPLPGREEYLDSEKYELKHRDWNAPNNIAAEIAQLNRIRRANPALHSHLGVTFYHSSNSNVIWFARATPSRDNVLLVAVNLDPFHAHETNVELPLWEWGLDDDATLLAEDLLGGDAFDWCGKVQTLRIDPSAPYQIWRVRPERER